MAAAAPLLAAPRLRPPDGDHASEAQVPRTSTLNILLRATAKVHLFPDLLEKVRAVEGAALEKAAA